jgi:hypothetical protein
MLNEIKSVFSLMKRTALWLSPYKSSGPGKLVDLGGNGKSVRRPSSIGIQIDPKLKSIGEWQLELERKIDRARGVIRENELNMKVLFLKEQRSQHRKLRNQKKVALH